MGPDEANILAWLVCGKRPPVALGLKPTISIGRGKDCDLVLRDASFTRFQFFVGTFDHWLQDHGVRLVERHTLRAGVLCDAGWPRSRRPRPLSGRAMLAKWIAACCSAGRGID